MTDLEMEACEANVRNESDWIDAECPTCKSPVLWRWTGLRAVTATGDENAACREYQAMHGTVVGELRQVVRQLVQALEAAESYARPNCPDLLKLEMPAAIIAGRKALGEWPEKAGANAPLR